MMATDKRSLISETVTVTRIDIHPTGERIWPTCRSSGHWGLTHHNHLWCLYYAKIGLLLPGWSLGSQWYLAWPSSWCLTLLPTSHLKSRGAIRQSSYGATRLIGPHKTRCAVSTNQSLPSGPKWPVYNQHRWGLPHRNLSTATILSPSFPFECSTDPPTCPAWSRNSNKHNLYSTYPRYPSSL
jgi:hypothetical protein